MMRAQDGHRTKCLLMLVLSIANLSRIRRCDECFARFLEIQLGLGVVGRNTDIKSVKECNSELRGPRRDTFTTNKTVAVKRDAVSLAFLFSLWPAFNGF